MGQNSISSFKYYFATDYMLETVLFVYCLLFIHTTYLYKLDASRNNILLNSQNNDITISSELMSTQSAENCKGFSETVRQLPEFEDRHKARGTRHQAPLCSAVECSAKFWN